MTREYDVVVAGHICLDLTPRFSEESGRNFATLLKPGKLIEVGEASISTGGMVSNTGLALYKLGIKTTAMAKVSDDALGRGRARTHGNIRFGRRDDGRER